MKKNKSDDVVLKTIQSIMYDLAKNVPVGNLNHALLNTLPYEKTIYCDKALSRWALQYAKAVMTGELPFTKRAVDLSRKAMKK